MAKRYKKNFLSKRAQAQRLRRVRERELLEKFLPGLNEISWHQKVSVLKEVGITSDVNDGQREIPDISQIRDSVPQIPTVSDHLWHTSSEISRGFQDTDATKRVSGISGGFNSPQVSVDNSCMTVHQCNLIGKTSAEATSVVENSSSTCSDPYILPLCSSETYILPVPYVLDPQSENSDNAPLTTAIKDIPVQINSDATRNYIPKTVQGATGTTKSKPLPKKKARVRRRRIIDLDYFLNMLKNMNQHSDSGCNLNNIIIVSETNLGLYTSLCLKCMVCDFQSILYSECPTKHKNVNADTVVGMMDINCSLKDMNILLKTMDLPSISHSVFIKEERKILSKKTEKRSQKTSKELKKKLEIRPQTATDQTSTFNNTTPHLTLKKLEKNVIRNPTSVTEQVSVSSVINKRKKFEHVDLNGSLLAEKHFETAEEKNAVKHANEFNMIIPQHKKVKTSEEKLVVSQEEKTTNTARIQQKICSDIHRKELTAHKSSTTKTQDNFLEHDNQPKVMFLQQKEDKTYENKIVNDKEQVELGKVIVNQDICDLSEFVT